MDEENRKPWENVGDAPEEKWRERKSHSESDGGEDSDDFRGGNRGGRDPRSEGRDGKRYGDRGGFKGGFKGKGGRGGFRGERDQRRGSGYRQNRDDRRDGRGRDGKDFRERQNWGSREGQSERGRDRREGRFDDRARGDRFEKRGQRNDRYSRGNRFEHGGRDGGFNGRGREGGFQRRDGGNRRDRGDYGRSRTFESKRGQGSTGRTRNLDIPASVTWDMLDKEAWRQLSPLPKETAEIVARHLVMSGELVDDNPELAYEHAKAALKMAWRIDVVREAVALTAYGSGKYAEALREVRTVRRMSGLDVLRAVEADCERGLGKPEKALEIIAETDKSVIDPSERLELAIVESAARADLGEHETGLAVVEAALKGVDPEKQSFEYGRLLSVKADRLRELGRGIEAEETEALIPREAEDAEIVDLQAEMEAEEEANPTSMLGTNVPLAAQFPVILCDLDGVTWSGDVAIDGATAGIEKARELGGKVYFLTNNAARPPKEVVKKLKTVGIKAKEDEIVTSAQDGAETLVKLLGEEASGAKVLCVGGVGVASAAKEVGFEPVFSAQDEPVAVLQGLGFEIGWKELSEACFAINSGAKWVATNLDMALPTENGRAIGNGSFVQAVRSATKAEPVVCGKPEESIYNLGIARASDYLRAIPEVAAEVKAFEESAQARREEALKSKAEKLDPDELLKEKTPAELEKEKETDAKMTAKRERRVFKHHTVAIGDQLATDILGAKAAGIPSCVVMTGLTSPRDLVMAPQNQRPDFVALDLTDLGLPFDRPELHHRGWWYCGDTRARVNDRMIEVRGLGVLEEDGTEVSLSEFRAILAAVWYAREQGVHVQCPDFKVVREVERIYEAEDDENPEELDSAEENVPEPVDVQVGETEESDE